MRFICLLGVQYPPIAAPTVPMELPPVNTAPPTAPTPAPIAVFLSRLDIFEQALTLIATVAITMNDKIRLLTVFILMTLNTDLTVNKIS